MPIRENCFLLLSKACSSSARLRARSRPGISREDGDAATALGRCRGGTMAAEGTTGWGSLVPAGGSLGWFAGGCVGRKREEGETVRAK